MVSNITPNDLRTELDVSDTELANDRAETHIQRAEMMVDNRIGNQLPPGDLKDEITVLVAADQAMPELTGAAKGQEVTKESLGSGSVTYASSGATAGSNGTVYWFKAVDLDPTNQLAKPSTQARVFKS